MGEGVKVRWLVLVWSACLLPIVLTRPDDVGDLDSQISEVFGKPNNNNGPGDLPVNNINNENVDNFGEEDCECVPYYLCNNGTVNTDGTGIIDIRSLAGISGRDKRSLRHPRDLQRTRVCESYIDECCKTPVTEPITPPPLIRHGCGLRNAEGVGFRITGNFDNEAQFGEFPWMVAILKEEEVEDGKVLNVYQCGGSLIHPKVVLTAAHCVVSKNLKTLKARGGEWDTQTTNELYKHQDRTIDEMVVHEKYYAGALYNDIALLILNKPFEHASNLDVVCLPKPGDVILEKECYASGWGKDTFGKEGQYQVILKKVELPMVERSVCQDALKKTRLGQRFKLHDSFVCAGGEVGKDTCKGDGGSPLVCPVKHGKESQFQQVGIVAWGIGCGGTNPAVYVNVANFVEWIDKQMHRFDLEPGYYY